MDEIEVKFFLENPEETRKRIIHIGAKPEQRVFEYNLRFDDADQNLIRKKSLLRLRKDSRTRITFKSLPKFSDPQFKIYHELEATVSDFDAMSDILKSLGYEPVQAYEKWRETFELPGAELCIDELPFGDFLEIEGEKNAITDIAEKLGFSWEKRILSNYLELFEVIKQHFGFSFSDVTFQNFEGKRIDFSAVICPNRDSQD